MIFLFLSLLASDLLFLVILYANNRIVDLSLDFKVIFHNIQLRAKCDACPNSILPVITG